MFLSCSHVFHPLQTTSHIFSPLRGDLGGIWKFGGFGDFGIWKSRSNFRNLDFAQLKIWNADLGLPARPHLPEPTIPRQLVTSAESCASPVERLGKPTGELRGLKEGLFVRCRFWEIWEQFYFDFHSSTSSISLVFLLRLDFFLIRSWSLSDRFFLTSNFSWSNFSIRRDVEFRQNWANSDKIIAINCYY